MTRLTRIPLALLLAGTLVGVPGVAMAHDELTGSDPESGSSGEAPEEVTLTYSGQISEVGAAVLVTDADGEDVVDGSPEVDGTTVVQDLVDDLPDGEYAVTWRVTSEDGHPISGEFDFTVVGSEEPEETSAPQTSSAAATEEESATEPEDSAPAETSTESTAEEQTSAAEETSAEASTEAETTQEASDASTEADPAGLPFWAWAFIVVAVLGLVAALVVTWSRSRR